MHYEPQVVLASGRIVGVEALMRWHHEGRGWISPMQFVPVAEDSDLIHPLGQFAIIQSCRQVKAWDQAGHAPLRLAVNVSARPVLSPGFVESAGRAVLPSELEPGRL